MGHSYTTPEIILEKPVHGQKGINTVLAGAFLTLFFAWTFPRSV